MMEHNTLSRDEIRSMIQHKKIRFAGNVPAKIYGALACKSGKRMKKENRIFFIDKAEAIAAGFRPCANCMPLEYAEWKKRGR